MAGANPKMDIVIHRDFANHPKIQEWASKGHRITIYTGPDADLLLVPFGHQWTNVDWDYAEAALATARARRKRAKR